MIVATFYTPRGNRMDKRYNYLQLLSLQAEGCRRLGWKQIVISDANIPGFNCFVAPLPENLMQATVKGQLEFLTYTPETDDIMFLDADCVPLHDDKDFLGQEFDMAFSTHPFDDCILNTGVMVVKQGSYFQARMVWHQALGICGPHWGADQESLATVVQASLIHGTHDRKGYQVCFFPVLGYNEAPEFETSYIDPMVIHFRGPRKEFATRYMARYYNSHE
jgi:hypothetical protein